MLRARQAPKLAARAILLCGCASFALQGQAQVPAASTGTSERPLKGHGIVLTPVPVANWTGNGGDGDWASGKNWSWQGDNGDCSDNGTAIPPGTFADPGSVCFLASVTIDSGTVSTSSVRFSSYILDFTLGSGSTLNGGVSAVGDVTISSDATVNGGISAGTGTYMGLTGTLTNNGTINLQGGVSACTIYNSGIIRGAGAIFTPFNPNCGSSAGAANTATNTKVIEATANLQLSGIWNNAGTIQIDANANLQADGTINGGNLINEGGAIVGGPLTLAGEVSGTALTIDAPGGPALVIITGTVNNSGVFSIGATAGVSTLKVDSGGLLTAPFVILGVQSGSSGQLEIDSGGFASIGSLVIGDNGAGYVGVTGSMEVGPVIVGNESTGHGELEILKGGTAKYRGLQGLRSTVDAVLVEAGGQLTGTGSVANSSQPDTLATTADVYGSWTIHPGIALNGGTLHVWTGGNLSVNCEGNSVGTSSCLGVAVTSRNVPGALSLSGNSVLLVSGSGATLTIDGGLTLAGLDGTRLKIENGAQANVDFLVLGAGQATIDGPGTQMTAIAGFVYNALLTVSNSATLNAALTLQDLTAFLDVLSSGTLSTSLLRVFAGAATIDSSGVVHMTGESPIILIDPRIKANPAKLTVSGQLDNATNIQVDDGGTLTIANAASVTMPGLSPKLYLGGGTVDVTGGEMVVGNAISAGGGWLTVGLGGLLSGGEICPTPSPEKLNPGCVQNSLYNGPGQVKGAVSNRGGTVSISDPTTLNVTQNFEQTSGTLELEIDGTQQGQYDQLIVGGSIQITGGTVQFDFANGFAPSAGNSFNLLTASGGATVSGVTFTDQGVESGFNYATAVNGGSFNLTAQNGGVSTTSPPAPLITSGIRQLSSAAGGVDALTPGSLAAAYAASGTSFSSSPPSAPAAPWPTSVNGISVTILDYTGFSTSAPLTYVSAEQVNFLIPDDVALGPALVTVNSGTQAVATALITLTDPAPSLFALNSSNLAAAYAACVSASGTITVESPFETVDGAIEAQPLNLSACSQTILELYGTGLDDATASGVQVTVGNVAGTVQYAGPGGGFPGLDQINVLIPQSLAGAGNVSVVATAAGMTSNTVNITIQ